MSLKNAASESLKCDVSRIRIVKHCFSRSQWTVCSYMDYWRTADRLCDSRDMLDFCLHQFFCPPFAIKESFDVWVERSPVNQQQLSDVEKTHHYSWLNRLWHIYNK